jgi:hypothetical protein
MAAGTVGSELRWRRANTETISIARRPDVARLDAIITQTMATAREARDILTLS